MTFLEVTDITKKFGEKTALRLLSMDLKENEVLGVIGHNGAGKTTLFKIILKMYAPDVGEISYNHRNFHMKNDIGYLSEQRGLYGKTDVYSQLVAFGYLKGKSKAELQTSIEYWLGFLRLKNIKKICWLIYQKEINKKSSL